MMKSNISPEEVELYVARHVQSIFEQHRIALAGDRARVAAHRSPNGRVGGAFFLVAAGGDERLTLAVGSVEGSGLRTALAKSLVLGAIRAHAPHGSSPPEVVEQIHALLSRLNGECDDPITCPLVHAVLDRQRGSFECCLAGQPCLVATRDGRFVRFAHGSGVPGKGELRYESQSLSLAAIGRVWLYTTRLAKAIAGADPAKNGEHLQNVLEAGSRLPVERQLEAIRRAVPGGLAGRLEPDGDVAIVIADLSAGRARLYATGRRNGNGTQVQSLSRADGR